MTKLLGKIKYLFWLLVIVSISGLSFGIYYLNQKIESESETGLIDTSNVIDQGATVESSLQQDISYACGEDCKQVIAQEVAKAVATISGTTKETVIETQTVVQSVSGTDFIPMGTSFLTTSTTWVDVPDSAVYFDLINDYGKNATVSWEASLKVAHGNGKAFARLYDGTNGIAVDLSEVSTENNAEFMRITTGNLPFWRGHNLYKVQIKSLNSFEVTYSGGKIKVSY